MSFLSANGLTFHIQEMNRNEESTVVLVHGLLLGSLTMWYFTVAHRLSPDHRVVMYDLRGHGRSDKAETGFDLGTMTADLKALVDEMGLKRVSLVGFCYGSLIAMRYAMENPDRVDKLALLETPLPPSQYSEIQDFLDLPWYEMKKALPDQVRSLVEKRKRPGMNVLKHLRYLNKFTTAVKDLDDEPDMTDEELARIKAPTLAVCGDRSVCADTCDRLGRTLPNIETRRLTGGHWLLLDHTEEIGRLLRDFLKP